MPSIESLRIRETLHRETGPSEVPLAKQREDWLAFARTVPVPAGVHTSAETIAGVACLRVRPILQTSDALVVYLHGGGLIDGDPITHREFAGRIAATTGHAVLLVGYRLVPENPFPAALDDVVAVLRRLRERANCRIALGGDSSGAGLALAAAQHFRDAGLRAAECLFSISGVFDLTLSAPSMEECSASDPCLSVPALEGWLRHFGDAVDRRDPRLSPLFGRFHGLPPALFQVGSDEIWRDDSTRAATLFANSGCASTLRIWESMWHVWPMYAELPEARAAIVELGTFLDAHLGRETASAAATD